MRFVHFTKEETHSNTTSSIQLSQIVSVDTEDEDDGVPVCTEILTTDGKALSLSMSHEQVLARIHEASLTPTARESAALIRATAKCTPMDWAP